MLPLTLHAGAWPVRWDWRRIERATARGLEAIRDGAGMVWWDGSAMGLRLHGVIGLFDHAAEMREERS